MDTKVLLNLINDLLSEENDFDLNSKLEELIGFINQSKQSNTNNSDKINSTVREIEDLCKSSLSNDFTRSKLKIFNSINAHDYFGINFTYIIDEVFKENQYNLQSIIASLQKLLTERKMFIEKLEAIQTNLTDLGIEPHFFTDETYEVGVIIPDKKDLHNTNQIEKQIHNWNFVFKTLSEVAGQEVKDTKIDRVSEGCIELFFHQAFDIAEAIGTALSKIALIYVTIREIKKHREGLKELKVPASETKAIEDHEKKLIDVAIDEATDEIMKKHSKKVDANRKNELKTAVNKSIRFIARSIDSGIEIEIIPPYSIDEDDEEIDENDTIETKKLKTQKQIANKKKEERIEIIKKSGNILKDVSDIGSGVLKLLTGGDDKLEEK